MTIDVMDELLSVESTTMYEKSLLGVMMDHPALIDDVSSVIEVNDLLNNSSKAIYSSLVEMNISGAAIDLVSLLDNLDKKSQLKQIGGITAVVDVRMNGGAKENAVAYAEIIKKRSTARRLSAAGQAILELGKGGGDVEENLAMAHEALEKISNGTSAKDFYHVKDLVMGVTEGIDDRISNGSKGTLTDFHDLDDKLNGLAGGDLIIIAGRPSMGKTIIGMQIATKIAIRESEKLSTAVFSLEMTKNQLVERAIAQIGSVEYRKIASGEFDDTDYDGLGVAIQKLANCNMYINDTPALTHQQVYVKARALAKKLSTTDAPLGAIVIDYLQIMGYSGTSNNRDAQIGEISRSLKKLAKELNIPIILLSQLNRGVEQRQDKRPVMSDLRESGAIEQDADIIMMVYRDEYYNPDSEYKGICEVIIRKNRNGGLGTIGLGFEGRFVRMINLERKWGGVED